MPVSRNKRKIKPSRERSFNLATGLYNGKKTFKTPQPVGRVICIRKQYLRVGKLNKKESHEGHYVHEAEGVIYGK